MNFEPTKVNAKLNQSVLQHPKMEERSVYVWKINHVWAYKKKHEGRVEHIINLYHMHDDTSAFSDGVLSCISCGLYACMISPAFLHPDHQRIFSIRFRDQYRAVALRILVTEISSLE